MVRGLPLSILVHLLTLVALAVWGGLTPMTAIEPQHVMRVRLAPLPRPEPAVETPATPEPEPIVAPPEAEADTPPAEPEPEPVEVEPVLPPKTVPEQRPESEPEPEVTTPEPPATPARDPEPAAAPAETEEIAVATEPMGLTTDEVFPFDYYLATVRNNVARRWRPKQLGFRGQAERSCVVHFVIGRGGQVSQVVLVRSSGVSLYDREALRAVKASRMPPLPAKFASPSLGVTFTFTLQSGV
jgi:protein TonB